MRHSTTDQAILGEGRQAGLQERRIVGERRFLLLEGTKTLGQPGAAVIAGVEAIHDIDRLESLTDRIVDATAGGWNERLRGSWGPTGASRKETS